MVLDPYFHTHRLFEISETVVVITGFFMVIFFTATGSFPDNSLVFQISPFPDDVRSSFIPACPSVGVKRNLRIRIRSLSKFQIGVIILRNSGFSISSIQGFKCKCTRNGICNIQLLFFFLRSVGFLLNPHSQSNVPVEFPSGKDQSHLPLPA